MSQQAAEIAKHTTDVAAASVALGAVVNWLPDVAALFTILWMMLRIWESDTVRKWTKRYS